MTLPRLGISSSLSLPAKRLALSHGALDSDAVGSSAVLDRAMRSKAGCI